MRKDEFNAFRELMSRAADITVMPNGKDLERVTLALFEGLESYPFVDVAEAVAAYCRSERFFPMLADIVERIEGKGSDKGLLAWSMVLKAVARYGHWESVRFPDPTIHWAVAHMGGWRHLSPRITDDNERFLAQDFARWYAIGERAISAGEEPPAYLVGEHEADNRARGYAMRGIRDVETGRILPSGEAPALGASTAQAKPLIQLVAGGMDAREAVR